MLDSISFAQKQRLAYIDFCLLFKGAIYRQDLVNRFQVGLSAGSRDFEWRPTSTIGWPLVPSPISAARTWRCRGRALSRARVQDA